MGYTERVERGGKGVRQRESLFQAAVGLEALILSAFVSSKYLRLFERDFNDPKITIMRPAVVRTTKAVRGPSGIDVKDRLLRLGLHFIDSATMKPFTGRDGWWFGEKERNRAQK